jgi:UDP-glucose 4-epimerase
MRELEANSLSRFSGQAALVTGGCGFIGSHLVELLVSNGVRCSVVDSLLQHSFRNVEHLSGSFRFYDCDVTDARALQEVFEWEKPALVFHLAAHHFIPYCDAHTTETVHTNCIGTQCIVDACRRFQVERLFYASSAAVYTPSPHPHAESEAADPIDLYGATKYAGERLVSVLARQSDTIVSIGRYFNAVGPRETNPHILREILRQFVPGVRDPVLRLGNLAPKRDYIHVQDLAEATAVVTCAIRPEQVDIVNIGTGSEWSVEELVEIVGRELSVNFRVIQDPARARRVDRLHLCANVEKARSKYNWVARLSLRDAVRDVLAEAGLRPDR